jgi:hypothetical protein
MSVVSDPESSRARSTALQIYPGITWARSEGPGPNARIQYFNCRISGFMRVPSTLFQRFLFGSLTINMSADISCAVFCSRSCTATLLLQFNCKNSISLIGPPPLSRRIFGGNLSSSPSPPPFRTRILLSGLFDLS